MCIKIEAMVGDAKIVLSLIQTTVRCVMTVLMMSFKYLYAKLTNYTNIFIPILGCIIIYTYVYRNIIYFYTYLK